MGILVIALSINPRPLSTLELKLSGLIMESRVDTAGDNQNAQAIISNYSTDHDLPICVVSYYKLVKGLVEKISKTRFFLL